MSKIVLQPVSTDKRERAENYFKKVYQDHLDIKEYEGKYGINFSNLEKHFPDKRATVFGVKPGDKNTPTYEKIDIGDRVLFCSQETFFTTGIIVSKMISPKIAELLWGEHDDGTLSELLYFIKDIKYIQIPARSIFNLLGYKENYILQGLTVLGDEKSRKIFTTFDELKSETSLSLDKIPPTVKSSLSELSQELFLAEDCLQTIDALLREKLQVIFYGPPGTGKTYVARRFAEWLTGHPDHVMMVQFHPSYAYEDFVEGLRPIPSGDPGFRLLPGPLKRIAKKASNNPQQKFVLIIDEINRGNLAKVLGELFFLLEYRSEGISLQYSDEEFKLPPNLYFIGTMNTADRSIALLDSALRRRFYFYPFFPDQPPVKGLLERYLTHHKPEYIWLAKLLERVNQNLSRDNNRHCLIGPSYFMKTDHLSDDWIRLVWDHSIMPYLEEQFFGDSSKLDQYKYENISKIDREENSGVE